MFILQSFICTFLALFMGVEISNCKSHDNMLVAYRTIYVDPSGHGNFSTIQSAIDSVPLKNRRWTCIYIKAGVYKEQVTIPADKPFIYIKGEGKRKTNVVWGAHASLATSATFTSLADNIVAKSVTFRNSYNYPSANNVNARKPAVAAMISGDKSAFYRCDFLGLQDTLWDVQGRHYFKLCTIRGAVDFIFGAGQSIYERCTIWVMGRALDGLVGFITAQGRSNPTDLNGFVFKDCNVIGSGKTFLGRPWREYARVIFYNTSLSNIIIPQGWSAGESVGQEYKLTFAEYDCHGLGSNTSQRVKWENKLSPKMLRWLTNISFIDTEGWISRQIFNMLL